MHNLKGSIVERVESPKTHRVGVIRLDKRTMTFWARADDEDLLLEPYSSKNGSEVRAWLMKQLNVTTEQDRLEWVPVVKIECGGERNSRSFRDEEDQGNGLSLKVDRYWLALTRDKREWRKLPWNACDPDSATNIPENDRYAASRKYGEGPLSQNLSNNTKAFRLPHFADRSYYGGSETVMQWTPELWQGLLTVIEQIGMARATIEKLMNTKQGVAIVAEIGTGKAVLQLQSGSPAK